MKESLQSRFGLILKRERIFQKLTQQEVADAAGMDLRSYQRIEAGERNIELRTIERLAIALKCNVVILLQ